MAAPAPLSSRIVVSSTVAALGTTKAHSVRSDANAEPPPPWR